MTNTTDPVIATLLGLPYSRQSLGRPKSSTRIWLENNRAYIPPLIHKRALGWKAIAEHLNKNGYTLMSGAPVTPQSLMEMWSRIKRAHPDPPPEPDFVFPDPPEAAEAPEEPTAVTTEQGIEEVAAPVAAPQILRIIRK